MHPGRNVNDIPGNADASRCAGVRPFVNAPRLGPAGYVVQEGSIHDHLHVCIADTQQLANSVKQVSYLSEQSWGWGFSIPFQLRGDLCTRAQGWG